MMQEQTTSINTSSCNYADDVTGCFTPDTDDQLQEAITMLMSEYGEYFSVNGLSLNQDKGVLIVL